MRVIGGILNKGSSSFEYAFAFDIDKNIYIYIICTSILTSYTHLQIKFVILQFLHNNFLLVLLIINNDCPNGRTDKKGLIIERDNARKLYSKNYKKTKCI